MEYNKISQEIVAKLQALVGAQNVLTEGEQMEIYAHDEVTDPAYHHMPEAVVFAENAQQVAAVVKLAKEHLFPVVPRGAGTGLACGAVPVYGGVVLSLEKMNKILEEGKNVVTLWPGKSYTTSSPRTPPGLDRSNGRGL